MNVSPANARRARRRVSQFALALCLVGNLACSVGQAQTLPNRLGDLDADSQATVLDLQRLINHINAAATNPTSPYALSAALRPFADIDEDGVINTNDLALLQNAILGLSTLPNPYAAPVLNAPVTATNGTNILITGAARPNRTIIVQGGQGTTSTTAGPDGRFTINITLQSNRVNYLYFTASNGTFTAGTPQPLRIIQDSQSPSLYLDFPTNNQVLHTTNTVIAGRVGDMLSGFMGLNVWVHSSPSEGAPVPPSPLNGERGEIAGGFRFAAPVGDGEAKNFQNPKLRPAAALQNPPGTRANVNVGIGNNGTFERSLVPLAPGTNLITVTAADLHGNSVIREIRVIRGSLTGPRLQVVSGDMQLTNIGRRLAQPIAIRVTGADGTTPIANKLVDLEVTRNDGRLLPYDTNALVNSAILTNDITRTPNGVMHLQLFTDANGEARAWWTLGGAAGCGNNRVCVTSAGISNAVFFCASAAPGPIHQINIGTGNNQKAETGAFVTEPLRAWVSDSCNGINGVPVTFRIVQGGGRLSPLPSDGRGAGGEGTTSLTITSSITGHAEALLQLGPDAGQNIIEANYPGNPMLPATFIAYGVARDPSRPTTFSGLVLDNTSHPIGHAHCELHVAGQSFSTFTDAQGRFTFGQPGTTNSEPETIPSGPTSLHVDGLTATSLGTNSIPPGTFPPLHFSFTLIPNADNALPMPVLLPCMNTNNAQVYHGTNDLLLTCQGIEGLKMTIKAGSMRKPDGTLVTPTNPAVVSLNQVHHDNVPMPMPDGASPPFAWTLQPGGAHFDPPITIEYPNMSGLPAGGLAYFLSYNHDTERFEIVASGHVTPDSASIVTDPGAGLTIAGWGCNCPPYTVTGDCEPCASTIRSRFLFQRWPIAVGPGATGGSCGFSKPHIGRLFRCKKVDCDPPTYKLDVTVVGRTTIMVHHPSITDKADIADAERHERQHEEYNYDFVTRILPTALAGLINADYAYLSDCVHAKEQARRIYLRELAALKRRHDAWDTGAEPANCTRLKCKYGLYGPLTCFLHCPASECLPGFGPSPIPSPQPEPLTYSLVDEGLENPWVFASQSQVDSQDDSDYFFLSNLPAPDQFGPGGPGTLADFVSDDYVRVLGVSTKGGTNRYAFSEFFQIRQGQTTYITNLTFTNFPPLKPESISVVPQTAVMRSIGQANRLRVMARYSIGTTEDVSGNGRWTSYRVSNPNIATVDSNGVVKAVAAGVVYVTAVN